MNELHEPLPTEVEELKSLLDEANKVGASAAAFSAERLRVCISIGSKLTEWKKLIPHGQWQAWLNDRVPDLVERTRQRWMRLAQTHAQGRLDLDSAHGLRHAYQLAGLLPEATGSTSKTSTKDTSYVVHVARLTASLRLINITELNAQQRLEIREKLKPILDFTACLISNNDSQ